MNDKKYFLIIMGVLLLVAGFIVYGVMSSQTASLPKPVSQLVLSPSPFQSPTPAPEPVVSSWRTYSNEQYNFTLEVPEGWVEQDYARNYPNGGTVVAFSPDSLPCATCTYVSEGYFSVRVYNQKTQPDQYEAFIERIKKIGKDPNYKQVALDRKPGVYSGRTISIENERWVYELSVDKPNIEALESYIFQRAATTFKFTFLLFND